MTTLYGLTTERLSFASGIDIKHPRFAWKIAFDEPHITQLTYRVTVLCECGKTVWDSEEVASRDMLVRYAGEPLLPATDYTWTLTCRISSGETLTAKAKFMTGIRETGLLEKAKWIAYPQLTEQDRNVCPVFRKEFVIEKEVKSVKLFTSGCGVYIGFVNGERLSNLDANDAPLCYELKPGYTQMSERKFYHSYDVTHLVNKGRNCLSAISSHGWWADAIAAYIGRYPAFLSVLIVNYADGTSYSLLSDETWKVSSDSPVVSASIYDGESYDARVSTAFMQPSFDDAAWPYAMVSDQFDGVIEAMHGEPSVCRDDLCRKPVSVYTYESAAGADEEKFGTIDHLVQQPLSSFVLKKGHTAVVDFGQNAAGREFFTVIGKKGTRITIRHAEMLNDQDGLRSRGNDGPEGSIYVANLRGIFAGTTYIIGEDNIEESYRPLLTFYGFRYVDITATEDVTFTNIVGEVVTNVGHDSGTIETGDTLVNRLIENGKWGMYSNYLSIPTDCPQRDERCGWTADTQVFATTAHYFSTGAQTFLEKWMQDMRDVQDPGGQYPDTVPRSRAWNGMGHVGWADAGILTPYYVWRMTGDITVVAEHYHSMKKYMDDFLAKTKKKGPAPTYGDWLSFEPNSPELQAYLGVCYYAWDALLMSEMADGLGKKEDASHYRRIYEKEKEFFIENYVNEDGSIKLSQQTAALFALKLELLPDEQSVRTVKDGLIANFKQTGNRLQTGFLGTSILLPTLSELGLNDLAYSLLLQDEMPSWLYSVKAGATTVWERWNSYSVESGFGDVGMNSFNHYAYGCVCEWLFGYAAGIRPSKIGFTSFTLAPIPDARLGHVNAEYDSVYGRIRSAWRYENDQILYECTVPANTTATLIHPKTGETTLLTSGDHSFVW